MNIAGQPFAPPAIPSKQQPTTASLFTRFVRYLPALALSLLCLASASCVLLLVLLPTAGLTAPFGHAHDLRSVMAPVAGYCILTGYACVWALAVASALAVVRTPPGHIPLWLYSREPGDQAYFHNVLQAVEKKLDGSLRFCRKCGAFKPDLAHHSKELGLCILTYQHWDLWANNAIGFYNHKTYLLTLGYSAFAHLLGAILLLPGVIRAEIGLSELPGRTILAVWHGGEASVTSYACLSLTASLILGGFSLYAAATTQHAFSVFSLTHVPLLLSLHRLWLLFHGYLIGRGTTAHSFFRQLGCTSRKPPKPPIPGRPFDFGPKGNWARACGRNPLLWLLPSNQGVEGNGIFFELNVSNSVEADMGGTTPWAKYP